MIKYTLKDNSLDINSPTIVADYLRNLGIEKVSSFLDYPDESDFISPYKLKNLEAIVDELHYAFTNNKKFYLQPDPDVDGYTSAAMFYRYFKNIYPDTQIVYEMHVDKEHGIRPDKIPVWVDYVIIPDAGSNDFEQQRQVTANGRKVIIIDHHSVDNFQEIENVLITNNQLSPDYPNKDLTGAGMVYKLIHMYSHKYHDGKSHRDYLDLAAIGLISDMADSRELDNNYIIYHGLNNIKNPMIQELLIKQSYSVSDVSNPSKIDIAFYIAPLINALVRAGTQEENYEFFTLLLDYENTDTFVHAFRGRIKQETAYQKMARELSNIRNKQNTIKEKAMEFLDTKIENSGAAENAILTVVASKDDDVSLPKTLTGLVAMEFVKKYKKPVLVLRPRTIDGELFLFGSGRANPVEGFHSFRDELNKSGIVTYAQGHDSAFGAGIKATDLPVLNEYMNKHFSDIDFGSTVIDVDYAFEYKPIQTPALYQFAQHSKLYGNQIPQPRFAFKFILPNHSLQVMGAKQNTMKITYSNIDFIQFHAKESIEQLTDDDVDFSINGVYEITIIGRPQLNHFRGETNLVVIIDHFEAKNIESSINKLL